MRNINNFTHYNHNVKFIKQITTPQPFKRGLTEITGIKAGSGGEQLVMAPKACKIFGQSLINHL